MSAILKKTTILQIDDAAVDATSVKYIDIDK